MGAEVLLSCLKGVRKRGQGQWMACCPHHEDKSPSLSVRLLDDERILLHCFAGCSPAEVLGSVGLSMSDL
ncbi:MAG: CHC2 zinc finger domain-containing protein, partial [Candidatus Sedimenticola sp. (ex Thyasira tokunagai)]